MATTYSVCHTPSSTSSRKSCLHFSSHLTGSVSYYLCLCLLTILCLPVMSAPMPESSSHFWVNPCGYSLEGLEVFNSVTPSSVHEIYDTIITTSNDSHMQSSRIKNYLITSNENLDEQALEHQKYDWLSSPPATVEHFRTLNRDKALQDTFFLMQKYAIAIDQIERDQVDKGEFHEFINEAKLKSVQLLCSLQSGMLQLNIEQQVDAKPQIMPDDLRNLPESGKMIRDYLIIRDYTKATYYCREMVKYFRETQ